MTGTLPLVTVRATDPNGAYADAYVTIIINDYTVAERKNGASGGRYPDQTLFEKRKFAFAITDNLFFD